MSTIALQKLIIAKIIDYAAPADESDLGTPSSRSVASKAASRLPGMLDTELAAKPSMSFARLKIRNPDADAEV